MTNGEFSEACYITWFVEFMKRIAGHFPLSEDLNRVEVFCGISIETFRYLCSLVMGPLSHSPKYKYNDKTELTLFDKVAIAMRRLKLGKSLNSIADEIQIHSFTADKVTRSFVEALAENGLRHLHGPATKEEMTAEELTRLEEEWRVLKTVMKNEKRRSMITACRILHDIVTDTKDERHCELIPLARS